MNNKERKRQIIQYQKLVNTKILFKAHINKLYLPTVEEEVFRLL